MGQESGMPDPLVGIEAVVFFDTHDAEPERYLLDAERVIAGRPGITIAIPAVAFMPVCGQPN